MDWEAWRAAVHGVTKSQTRLSDGTELKVVSKKWVYLERSTLQMCEPSQKATGYQIWGG